MKRMGVLTGGGDAPGLNAVIRAVVIRLLRDRDEDYECICFIHAWSGLRDHQTPLLGAAVDFILHQGGTILGASKTHLCQNEDEAKRRSPFMAPHGLNVETAPMRGMIRQTRQEKKRYKRLPGTFLDWASVVCS